MKASSTQSISERFHRRAQRKTRWAIVMLLAILAQSFASSVHAVPNFSVEHSPGQASSREPASSAEEALQRDAESHAKIHHCKGMGTSSGTSAEQSPDHHNSTSLVSSSNSCCDEGCNMTNCHGFSAVFSEFKALAMRPFLSHNASIAQFHNSALLPTPFRPPILAALG